MSIERVPIFNLEDEQSDIDRQTGKLSELSGLLETLKNESKTLSEPDAFLARKATLGTENSLVLSASPAAGTARGNYDFAISQIATGSTLTGRNDAGSAISASADVSGVTLANMRLATPIQAGTFMVNGSQVNISTADSLQDVFDSISTATGGAVTAGYNPTTDKIEMNSASEIVLGSGSDTSNFLAVTRLFSNGSGSVESTDRLSLTDIEGSIANAGLQSAITAVDGDGNGSFSINGVTIDYNISEDSLGELMERINDSDAGVSMDYDVSNDRFRLLNKDTGTLGISTSEAAGGLMEALGLDAGTGNLTLGVNAKFTVNGGNTLESTSNEITAAVHGIEGLNVTLKDTGNETVSIEADTENSREKVDAFIEAYNKVQNFIDTETGITVNDDKVTTNALTDNREVSSLARELRATLFSPISGLTGTIKRLQDIGIDFDSGKDTLSIDDSDAFDKILTTDGDLISSIFSDASDGIFERLDTIHENYAGTNGTFSDQTERLNNRKSKIDDEIDTLERLMEQRREALEASFIAMEEAQAQADNQLQALVQSFGG